MRIPEFKLVTLDGEPVWKLKCPDCGQWGYIDDDQYCGSKYFV
jgi:hypothetical protein